MMARIASEKIVALRSWRRPSSDFEASLVWVAADSIAYCFRSESRRWRKQSNGAVSLPLLAKDW